MSMWRSMLPGGAGTGATPAAAWRRRSVVAALAVACLGGLWVPAKGQDAPARAAALQAQRAELLPRLRASAFGQPLVLDSREGDDSVDGEVRADMPQPFTRIAAAFQSGATICELLMLHLNVHACRASGPSGGETLVLSIGSKRSRSPGMMQRMAYQLRVAPPSPGYLRVDLTAREGPLSTHDYRIVLEAVPVDAGSSFVRLGYAYSFGPLAKAAMGLYLATAGRSKIGFTVLGRDADGRPQVVRGERGALERNVVRYYLAVLAHCSVDDGPVPLRIEARLRAWHALTEHYADQLHELDLDEYLEEKRLDFARRTEQQG